MEKELLTVRSVSKLLDMSEHTTYKLASKGVIPGRIKIEKSVRFNKEIVLDWLENGGANK